MISDDRSYARRNRGRRTIVAGALPVIVALSCAGVAAADPTQPGVTGPAQPGAVGPAQPGVTTGPATPVISTAPAGVDPLPDEIAPRSDYSAVRPLPAYHYVAPLRPDRLHSPQPLPPVAPILAPPGTIRFGDLLVPAPFVAKPQLDQINAVGAGYESQISTAARSVGVAPSRADSIASAAVAAGVAVGTAACIYEGVLGGIATFLIGAPLMCAVGVVAFGLPAALIGAGVGGLR
jgi:hypothetical protein